MTKTARWPIVPKGHVFRDPNSGKGYQLNSDWIRKGPDANVLVWPMLKPINATTLKMDYGAWFSNQL